MTGALKVSDGSAGSPAVQFNSASSTGFYKTTNGIGVSVGGVKVAEFTSGGVSRNLGELIPYTGLTAPALTVLPYGQSLSRTTYADLWAFAQTEIAAGNTFYNNGNGTTTFGIGDLRGRVVAGKDNMGGIAAGRLTSTYFGADPTVVGAAGGSQNRTLVTANLPPYTPAGSISNTNNITATVRVFQSGTSSGFGSNVLSDDAGGGYPIPVGGNISSAFSGNAQGGTSTAFSVVQPTMICNFILFAGA
jgi:microcystin-dependent protein